MGFLRLKQLNYIDMKIEEVKNKFISENRKNATIYEKLMMLKLKVARIKFVTQYAIDYKNSFILCDFYIPKYKLIIEVDGLYHDEILQISKDIERDRFLRENGYQVLRLFNSEIDTFDTLSIKTLFKQEDIKQQKKVAVKVKYTLAQKAEDKKKLTPKQFKQKYQQRK